MGWKNQLIAGLRDIWICLLGWIPTQAGTVLRWLGWKPLFASCGRVRFGTGVDLAGTRGMSFADGVRVGRHCILTAQNGSLEMGEDACLSPNVNVGADDGTVIIGAKTAIGMGTVLRCSNHRIDRTDIPIMAQGHVSGKIVIGEDVWIGANCVITPDVTIGCGAVVGAGAVVTRDVAPRDIVAGVPARVIGHRGSEHQESGPSGQ